MRSLRAESLEGFSCISQNLNGVLQILRDYIMIVEGASQEISIFELWQDPMHFLKFHLKRQERNKKGAPSEVKGNGRGEMDEKFQ